jgi:hypothetical protein
MEAVSKHTDLMKLRSDKRNGIILVALDILNAADNRTKTSQPGWVYIMRNTGLSRVTVYRAIRWLREQGLLGLVACGRAATHLPKGSKQEEGDRAVYVLCQPVQDQPVLSETIPVPVGELPPLRAREPKPSQSKAQAGGATHRLKDIHPAFGAPLKPQREERRLAPWSGTRRLTPAGTRLARRRERLQAAVWLRDRLNLALNKATLDGLAHVIRPFLDAGWNCNDLVVAVDHRPDDGTWDRDGFHGVRFPARVLELRLRAWMVNGEPMLSLSQRQRALQAERHALLRLEVERRAREARERETLTSTLTGRVRDLKKYLRELPPPAWMKR